MAMILPLLNFDDQEWVDLIGRYILNMGSVEAGTRILVSIHEKNDRARAMTADLPSRLGFLRNKFPLIPKDRHAWAMKTFKVASKHVGFRNIIAHSPLIITGHEDGSQHIQGILNLTPNDEKKAGELIGIDELRGRVNESAELGELLLQMQSDYASTSAV